MKKLKFDDIKGRVSKKYPDFSLEVEEGVEITFPNPFRQEREWREKFTELSRVAFPGISTPEDEEAEEGTEAKEKEPRSDEQAAVDVREVLAFACTSGNFELLDGLIPANDLTTWYEVYDAYIDEVSAGER